jgi:hypothetical protein
MPKMLSPNRQELPHLAHLRFQSRARRYPKLDGKYPRIMALLRIFRQLCEDDGISLGLKYLPSILNTWADRLSRQRDFSDWALTPNATNQIQNFVQAPITSQVYARRETAIPQDTRFYSTTGTGDHDRAEKPLPQMKGDEPWPMQMGFTVVSPSPAQCGAHTS